MFPGMFTPSMFKALTPSSSVYTPSENLRAVGSPDMYQTLGWGAPNPQSKWLINDLPSRHSHGTGGTDLGMAQQLTRPVPLWGSIGAPIEKKPLQGPPPPEDKNTFHMWLPGNQPTEYVNYKFHSPPISYSSSWKGDYKAPPPVPDLKPSDMGKYTLLKMYPRTYTEFAEHRGLIVNKKMLKDLFSHKNYFDESSYSESSWHHEEPSGHEDSSVHAMEIDGYSGDVDKDGAERDIDKTHPAAPKITSSRTHKILFEHKMKNIHGKH